MHLLFTSRRFRRLNLPGALLIALLQRTPFVRLAITAESVLASSGIGAVLRGTIATVASLGVMQSMAGATPLVPTSGTATGLSVTTGTAVSVAYTVNGTQTPPASWTISGDVPPGLNFSGLTSAGTVNAVNLKLGGTPTTAGTYALKINAWEGQNGTLISSPVYDYTITVTGGSTTTAPTITAQPQSVTVAAGDNTTFSVTATGSPTPTYQWSKDGTAISGATSTSLALTNVQSTDAGNYTVVVTNSAGSVTSATATLTLATGPATAPAVAADPIPQVVVVGSTAVLTASVSGSPTPTLQWRRDGNPVSNDAHASGATTAQLTLTGVTAADAGTYTLVAQNSAGTAITAGAMLTVNAAPTSSTSAWLTNVSVRTQMQAGQLPLIVGFTVAGGSKNILVRAAGPALAAPPFNVAGTMADPKLLLFPNGASTATFTNDDWDASLAATFTSLQAFPFPAGSKDAAFVQPIDGAYTVQAPATGAGLLLVEAYDTDPSTSTQRLVNLSARNRVGTGANVLIEGFAIGGSGTKTLLIRAVGPKLLDYGLGTALRNPKLEIYSGTTRIAVNDDWDPALATTFDTVHAFQLNPGSKDSAIVVTLAAGAIYTVQVSGADGTTGDALAEVYEVP